ncbi:MAG: PP2C family protein-serine/threonine phosphatase [Candidatus Eiseniibacteriota bacterium]
MPILAIPQDPKRLYRQLDALLAGNDSRRPASWLQASFLAGLFEALQGDLELISARLFAEREGRFPLVARQGSGAEGGASDSERDAEEPPVPQPGEVEFFDPVEVRRALDFPAAVVHAAALTVGLAPHRRVLAFGFREPFPRERAEFALHTVRSALDARYVEARVRGSLHEAADIQRSLLLERAPEFQGFDIACRSVNADEVGGDFFDFYPLAPDLLGCSIGDASGHGLPAALLVRDVVTGLRMGVGPDLKATAVMGRLNRVIGRSSLSSRFVSVFYAELEHNGSLTYVNAGHPPPLLFSGDRCQELTVGGSIMGPIAEARYTRGFAHLDRGGVLLLCTDGLMERANPNQEHLGLDGLADVVRQYPSAGAAELIERLFERALDFGRGARWSDDATAMVIRRHRHTEAR